MVMLGVTVCAQQKKSLNAYISYAVFDTPGENSTPYVETYITFDKHFNSTFDIFFQIINKRRRITYIKTRILLRFFI